MVQACLPAVPRIRTVTDGLGSVRTEMGSFMEEQDGLLVINFTSAWYLEGDTVYIKSEPSNTLILPDIPINWMISY